MITATTMAAMPMRYSFPEKRSSIFWWQSACGARPAGAQGCQSSGPPPWGSPGSLQKEREGPSPGHPQERREQGRLYWVYLTHVLKHAQTGVHHAAASTYPWAAQDGRQPGGHPPRLLAAGPELPVGAGQRLAISMDQQQNSAPGRAP